MSPNFEAVAGVCLQEPKTLADRHGARPTRCFDQLGRVGLAPSLGLKKGTEVAFDKVGYMDLDGAAV